MNQTIELMKKHASVRKFDLDYVIPEEEMQAIFDATRQASTWKNGQFYSIIRVKDQEVRQGIYECAPEFMRYIKNCNELVVFVGDFHRTHLASQMHDKEYLASGIEPLLIASVDASLAAQNFVLAAESLGYGAVIAGLIRDDIQKAAKVLNLPERTVPLFVVAMGKPAQKALVKPRLPQELVIHTDTYQEPTIEGLQEFDRMDAEFAGPRHTQTWTERMAEEYAKPQPKDSENLMKENGFLD